MSRYILFGRLRRDTMILNSGEDEDALIEEGKLAVAQARAAEVFVVEALFYASESEINFDGIGGQARVEAGTQALGNPSTGEQVEGTDTESEPTTPAAEIKKVAAEDAKADAKRVTEETEKKDEKKS